jgi:hypothetical protein
MRRSSGLPAALAAAILAVAITAGTGGASAQAPAADPAVRKTLTDAAKALGMVRGLERALDIVNMLEYTASGTVADATGKPDKVSRITAGYDYVIPAARVDIETATPEGPTRREITVASGALAWDEATPGIYLGPASTSAAERLRPIWLLPHGVILAAAKTPAKVKLTAGSNGLIAALPDGTEITGVLGADNLITHVEFKAGAHQFSGDYSDFKDFQGYGVMFPSRIVQKMDGKVVADLTVTEALANPNLIFPPPKEVSQKP